MSTELEHQLVWNIKNGDTDAVREVYESKKLDPNVMINGRNAIHYAADYGQKEIIEYLIECGADVNALDKHGISPLLAAIWEGHTECVRVLIENGAKIDRQTPDGLSYIDAAENAEIRSLLTTA